MTISGNTGISAPLSSAIFHAMSMSLVVSGFINVVIVMNKLLRKSRKKQADVQMTLFDDLLHDALSKPLRVHRGACTRAGAGNTALNSQTLRPATPIQKIFHHAALFSSRYWRSSRHLLLDSCSLLLSVLNSLQVDNGGDAYADDPSNAPSPAPSSR